MPRVIDLRSDTVTLPSLSMRKAMMECPLGDDMFGEDPTVNKLQDMVKNMFKKDSAILVPSGTMANELAIKALSEPGDAVIMPAHAHIYSYESGGAPFLSGITPVLAGDSRGVIEVEELETLVPPSDQHFAPVTVVSLENTHNGHVIPLPKIEAVHKFCQERNLKMHLDGARIFNAAAALQVCVSEIAQYFDTISFCLSKGLGTPMGSMVVCSNEKIRKRVHRFRKLFGGAMRQSGIIAAAGIYALENNRSCLAKDHQRAQRLANLLSEIEGVSIRNTPVETNMLFMDFSQTGVPGEVLEQELAQENVKIFTDRRTSVSRLVTHLDIHDEDIDRFVASLKKILVPSKNRMMEKV